jgi:hypothetical protein
LKIEEKDCEEEKKKKNKKKEMEVESLHYPWLRPLLLPMKIEWRRNAALESAEVYWNWTV